MPMGSRGLQVYTHGDARIRILPRTRNDHPQNRTLYPSTKTPQLSGNQQEVGRPHPRADRSIAESGLTMTGARQQGSCGRLLACLLGMVWC